MSSWADAFAQPSAHGGSSGFSAGPPAGPLAPGGGSADPGTAGGAVSDAELEAIGCAAPSRSRRRVPHNPLVLAAGGPVQPFDRAAHLEAARLKRQRLLSERNAGDGSAVLAVADASAPQAARHGRLTLKVPDLVRNSLATSAGSAQLLQFFRLARNMIQPLAEDAHLAAADAFSRMQAFFLRPGKQQVATLKASAEIVGVDVKQLSSYQIRLASACVHADRDTRSRLEAAIVSSTPQESLLLYVDCYRSDETPLRVRAQPEPAHLFHHSGSASTQTEAGHRIVHLEYPVPNFCAGATVPRKLLQSEGKFGMLFRRFEGGQQKLTSVCGSTVNWLQFVDRTTAEVLKTAHDSTSAVSEHAKAFKMKVRMAVEDQARSNERKERGIHAARSGDEVPWVRLQLHCQVHMVAGVFKKVFDLVDATIVGQVHFALAMNYSSGLHVWRQELAAVIKERLLICFGRPPQSAIDHKRQVLRLCLSRGSHRLEKLLALHALPNGDWRNPHKVECYLPMGAQPNPDAIAAVIAKGLVQVAASSKYTMWPRHRWTKADRALDEICILEACHGLASATFPRWVHRVSNKVAAPPPSDAFDGFLAVVSNDTVMPEGAGAADSDAQFARQAGNEPNLAGEEHGAERPDGDAPASAIDHQRHRSFASRWLASQPLGVCLVTRMVMEPLREYMAKQLFYASDAFEESQQTVEAARAMGGLAAGEREFRLGVAVKRLLDMRFTEQLNLLLLEPRLFNVLIPPRFLNLALRGLTFRMLSSSVCWMHEALGRRFSMFPLRLFRIMLEPNPDQELAKIPACLLDDFARRFQEVHQSEDEALSGEVAQERARLLMRLADLCISRIEVGHAAVRRRLYSRSTHTHGYDLERLSADHVLEKIRHTSRTSNRPVSVVDKAERAGPRTPNGEAGGQLRGGGGAWRAYVRQQSLGRAGLQDISALAQSYQALPDDAKQKLAETGALATVVHRQRAEAQANASGHAFHRESSFGLTARAAKRQATKQAHTDRVKRALSQAEASRAVPELADVAGDVVQQAHAGEISIQQAMTSARQDQRVRAEVTRRQAAQKASVVQAWVAERGKPALESMLSGFPALRCCSRELAPLPATSALALHLGHDAPRSADVVRLLRDNATRTNLGACLDLDWAAKHRPILHDECEPLPAETRRPTRPPCHQVGVCLCSDWGVKAYAFRNSFLRVMKGVFKRGSTEYKLLKDKRIVLRLHGRREACRNPWACAALGSGAAELDTVLYLHIGAHSWTPYYSTFVRLEEHAVLDEGGGHRLLKARCSPAK